MAKLIEKNSNYAYTIERIKNITFSKLRSVVIDFTKRLPADLNNELYEAIQHGVCQLQSEPELNMYIHALGLMHEAKLQYAFEHLSNDFTVHPTIDIIDYGCGQAIGTICYADFIRNKGIIQTVRKITLIEPSEVALKRAALHVSCFFPDAEIITILKDFDNLDKSDIRIDNEVPTLNILSNVIDLADNYYNLEKFTKLINDCIAGENQFVCIGPYFDHNELDGKIQRFVNLLGLKTYYSKTFTKGTFVEGHDWTCQVVICNTNSQGFNESGALLENHNIFSLRKAAEQGDANAQCNLGVCYEYGQGVDKDETEATKWYRKAAEQGNANAQFNLGVCYYYGRGIKRSLNNAAEWLKRSAEQGNRDSQYYIEHSSDPNGNGQLSDEESVTWYKILAEKGIVAAIKNLGDCYKDGEGVEPSYEEAAKCYQRAAERGSTYAQNCLATCYYEGLGVEQSYIKAIKWYHKAAERGNAYAQYKLGICYKNGQGVTSNNTEAIKWFHKAAEQGQANAQFNLGVCLRCSIGIDKSFIEAFEWFKKAARNGNTKAEFYIESFNIDNEIPQLSNEDITNYINKAEYGEAKSQYKLGVLYEFGDGVVQSYQKAAKWYHKAAVQGDPDAQYALGVCYQCGIGVEQSYEEAVKWYTKAANQNKKGAQFSLASCYNHGYGVVQSTEDAFKYFFKAAEQGHAHSQYIIGYRYEHGFDIVTWPNYKEAFKWYHRSAEQGFEPAQYSLGLLYYYGYGVEKSTKDAIRWLIKSFKQGEKRALFYLRECYNSYETEHIDGDIVELYRIFAEQGLASAQYDLGQCYYKGQGIEQSYTKALKWFHKAAVQGNATAQCNLGYCYDKGHGVDKDETEAVKWYRKAAEQGDTMAQYKLGVCYEYGRGVTKDKNEATKWYIKAAKKDNKEEEGEFY